MVVDILNNTDFNLEQKYIDIINNVIKKSLETEDIISDLEVSVLIATNEEVRKLNKNYRGIDSETDVLSFPVFEFEDYDNLEISDLQIQNSLGDIVISIDKAVSQAEEYGHSLAREIAFLIAHSMLHLLGYDHETKEDEELMFSITKNILNDLGYVR